ncbi:MAG: peptidase M48 Ste24p, partial [Chitinophaga rupis]
NIYKQPLKKPVREYFTAYQLPFEDAWTQKRSKGLSTHAYNFRDTATLEDSLKTHPDCIQRYKQTMRFATAGAKPTPIPAAIHDKATRMMIWNVYENANLTECLYRVMLEKYKGGNDAWYDFMTSNIFFGLFYADRELHRFNAVGITPKEYISKDYYQVQNMLEQMPRESLEQYCKLLQNGSFWTNMASGEKGLKSLLCTLAMDPDDSQKNRQKAAKEFTTNNSASMYCEFAGNFEKK